MNHALITSFQKRINAVYQSGEKNRSILPSAFEVSEKVFGSHKTDGKVVLVGFCLATFVWALAKRPFERMIFMGRQDELIFAKEILRASSRADRVSLVENVESIHEKFDLGFVNARVQLQSHLELIEELASHLTDDGELVMAHPGDWLTGKRTMSARRRLDAIKASLLARFSMNIRFVDNFWFDPSFAAWYDAAELWVPVCITSFKRGSGIVFSDSRTNLMAGPKKLPFRNQVEAVVLDSLDDITGLGYIKGSAELLRKIRTVGLESRDAKENLSFFVLIPEKTGKHPNTSTAAVPLELVDRTMQIEKRFAARPLNSDTIHTSRDSLEFAAAFKTQIEAKNYLHFISHTSIFAAYFALLKSGEQKSYGIYTRDVPKLDWLKEATDEDLVRKSNLGSDDLRVVDLVLSLIAVDL